MYHLKVQRVYIVSDLGLGLHLIHSFPLDNYSDFYDISQETLVLKGLKLKGDEIKLSKQHSLMLVRQNLYILVMLVNYESRYN